MEIFGYLIDGAIAVFGLFVLIRLLDAGKQFSQMADALDNTLSESQNDYATAANPKTHRRSSRVVLTSNRDMEQVDCIRNAYLEKGAKYLSWVQMIALFPLIGLFGTVVGLMGMKDAATEVLRASMGTALQTTLAGLIAAIILKVVDAFGSSYRANVVESKLSMIDKEYQDDLAERNYEENGME